MRTDLAGNTTSNTHVILPAPHDRLLQETTLPQVGHVGKHIEYSVRWHIDREEPSLRLRFYSDLVREPLLVIDIPKLSEQDTPNILDLLYSNDEKSDSTRLFELSSNISKLLDYLIEKQIHYSTLMFGYSPTPLLQLPKNELLKRYQLTIDSFNTPVGDTQTRSLLIDSNSKTTQSTNISESIRNQGKSKLHWIDLTNPNPSLLKTISEKFEISLDSLTLNVNQPLFDHQKAGAKCLCFTIAEPKNNASENADTKLHTVKVFFGKDFVITFHKEPINFIERVMQELHDGSNPLTHGNKAHYLAVRLLGACIHKNTETVEQLLTIARTLRRNWVADYPSEKQQKILDRVSSAAADIAHYSTRGKALIAHLGQTDLLFGAKEPSSRLREYSMRCSTIVELATEVQDHVDALTQSWELNSNRKLNATQYRLALLAGSAVPISIMTGFFGQNFAEPFTGKVITLGLLGASVVSGILLYGLRLDFAGTLGKFKRMIGIA
jgi:Mg2+ and Co2+ transporter CorA